MLALTGAPTSRSRAAAARSFPTTPPGATAGAGATTTAAPSPTPDRDDFLADGSWAFVCCLLRWPETTRRRCARTFSLMSVFPQLPQTDGQTTEKRTDGQTACDAQSSTTRSRSLPSCVRPSTRPVRLHSASAMSWVLPASISKKRSVTTSQCFPCLRICSTPQVRQQHDHLPPHTHHS